MKSNDTRATRLNGRAIRITLPSLLVPALAGGTQITHAALSVQDLECAMQSCMRTAVPAAVTLPHRERTQRPRSGHLRGKAHQASRTTATLLMADNSAQRATQTLTPPSDTRPESDSAPAASLPEMTVTVKPWESNRLNVTHASVATKTDAPIMKTPIAVQVVPRTVIDDQKVTRLQEIMENVSGVRPLPTLGTGGSFIIRGFPNQFRSYRNGLGIINAFSGQDEEFDTANLQSIEVLKGPAAVLFGRIEPGGLINVTTKRPLATPYYSLEQRFGSYSDYRTEWDATGPVLANKSLNYRFVGGYQNSGSFRDFVSDERITVNPSITWQPTEATMLTLDIEGLNKDYKPDFGVPVLGRRPAPIPVSRSLDDPNTPLGHRDHIYLTTELTHHFNDRWTLHNRFLANFDNNESTFVNPVPFGGGEPLRTDNRTLDRNIFTQNGNSDNYTTNLDLTGRFELPFSSHDTLIGFDYTVGNSRYSSFGDYVNPVAALAIDIFNPGPSYGIPKSVFDTALSTSVFPEFTYSVAKLEWWGVYFQDHITLWDKVHILGGGRYDWAERGRGFDANSLAAAGQALPASIRKDQAFSPRVGMLYQAAPWLSVYGNWTNSFGANNSFGASRPLPPEFATQFEAGLKTEWLEQRLGATLAYFHITKENLLTRNPNPTGPDDLNAAIGEARSQGIEFNLTGLIGDTSLIANYAYTDAHVTRDFSGLQGTRLNNVPEHSGSLWLKHEFTSWQPLSGLSLGVGAYAVGDRPGDAPNTFVIPGYVRLDAFAAYRWRLGGSRLTAQFNVRNLLDKQYYESTDPSSNVTPRVGIYPGATLTALGSLRIEY